MYSINLSSTDKNKISISEESASINDQDKSTDIQQLPQGGYSIRINNDSHHLYIENIDYKTKTATFNIDNKLIDVTVEEPIDLLLNKMGISRADTKKADHIKAPMPGLVLNIMVNEGDEIRKGQPILVLEAMKMENVFKAPADATIRSIKVKAGDAVEKGTVMMELM